MSTCQLIECSMERHGLAILEIFNDAILSSTALYDYEPRTVDLMHRWFELKIEGGFPVIGLEDDTGELVAFATYGVFRHWAAYRHTVEHSVYVHKRHRGGGHGKRLMKELIHVATRRDVHVMIGVIDSENQTSRSMHESLGFTHAGTLREVGYKFDRWLDVVFYQLILAEPGTPRAEN